MTRMCCLTVSDLSLDSRLRAATISQLASKENAGVGFTRATSKETDGQVKVTQRHFHDAVIYIHCTRTV